MQQRFQPTGRSRDVGNFQAGGVLAEAYGVAICRMRRALGLDFRLGAQGQR